MKLASPINLDTAVQFHAKLPDAVDVCIIGGGIIGISTALNLVREGQRVLVCEKGRIAGEQSSRNWGWVRQTGRDAAELPVMMESLWHWQTLASETRDNSLSFSQGGVLYLADTEAELREYDAFVALARQHGLDSRLLSSAEVAARIPTAGHRWAGALYTESDGRVEPWGAVPALARAAAEAGALLIEQCAVRSLQQHNGQLSGIMTERGPVSTSRVLLAGGAWSSLLLRQSGIHLPQLAVKATVARAETPGPLYTGNAADGELAFAARQDGGYTLALNDHHDFFIGPDAFRYLKPFLPAAQKKLLNNRYYLTAPAGFPDAWRTPRHWRDDEISPFERCRVVDPQASPKIISRISARLQRRFPHSSSARITHAWAGMIDTLPDFVPVLDQVEQISGLYLATGFSGHGFGIGPGVGRVMSDLLQGRDPGHDLSRFRLSRFSDGSALQLGPI